MIHRASVAIGAHGEVRATSLRSSAAARLDGRGARNYKRVFADEALSPGLAGKRRELLPILGIVDVEGYSWQVQHDTRLAGGLRSGVMRLEAVVAEAEREQIGGTAEGGVGAASVGGGAQNTAFGGRVLQDFVELPRLNQGDIGWDYERAVYAALDADAGGHLDGAGFSGIVGVGDDFEFVFFGQLYREGIAGDDCDRRTIFPVVQRGEHVMQHGLRQCCARGLIENRRQALLGRGQVLYRNEDHGWESKRRKAPWAWDGWPLRGNSETYKRTSRASDALSSAVRMMVCVHWTRKPLARRSSAARMSRLSHTRTSRKSS